MWPFKKVEGVRIGWLPQVEDVANGGTKKKVDIYSHDLVLNR
jgi:hypothetical protein